MFNDRYFIKNLIFLFLGVMISFVLGGLYSAFAGFSLLLFVILWFLFEFYYFKFFIKKTRNNIETSFDESIPFPYFILNSEKIVFENKLFKEVIGANNKKNIYELIPEYTEALKKQKVIVNNKEYTAILNEVKYKNKKATAVFLVEFYNEINKTSGENEPIVVGLVLVDNYDDATDNIEEVRRPMLSALIDRKLNTLLQQIGGIVKKFEKDKYIIVFSKDKIDYLKERKFDILNQIREIEMGNSIPVTLSIGLGTSEKSISQSMEYARQALDLALGRGGDQVLIKDDEKFYIYGGVSKEVGSNARVRARVKAYALGELIDEAQDVLIMGHKNADLDCLGSAIGVHTIVRAFGKNSKIVLNKISTSINLLYNRLLEEMEEYQEEIFVNGEDALKLITPNTLLIIVDTHRRSILETPELLEKTKKIVIFDHHRKSADFIENPVLSYHEPYASSTSELITEMLSYVKHPVTIKPVEADALLAGITVDTKNFAFKTGAKTFEAAAYLKRKGADSIKVRLLFQNKLEEYKAKAVAVKNAEIFNEHMAYSICPDNVGNPTLVTAQAADDLLNIYGIEASFVLCRDNDKIYISARSLGKVNVQVIMEKLGGGGHHTVAGAQIPNSTLEEAMKLLKEAINRYLQEV